MVKWKTLFVVLLSHIHAQAHPQAYTNPRSLELRTYHRPLHKPIFNHQLLNKRRMHLAHILVVFLLAESGLAIGADGPAEETLLLRLWLQVGDGGGGGVGGDGLDCHFSLFFFFFSNKLLD